jgi:hypothetical protein
MGKLDAGSRVVYHSKDGAQLGTVLSVTETGEDFNTVTSRDELIIVVRLDDGPVVPAPERKLSEADESQPAQVHFTPGATMTRAEGGWTLDIDFSDSLTGGVLAGVIVDDVPERAAACEALDAAIKRSPWHHKGGFRAFVQDATPPYLAPVLLVWGSPDDGFRFVGPVTPNDPELDKFVDEQLRNVNWWYAPLSSLEDAQRALD